MKISQYKKLAKQSKYRAVKTVVDGITFASKKEAKRYGELKFLEKHGKIERLLLQPVFPLLVNGVKICVYRGDFSYWYGSEKIVEDVKGFKTRDYRLKKKLFEAIFGYKITET